MADLERAPPTMDELLNQLLGMLPETVGKYGEPDPGAKVVPPEMMEDLMASSGEISPEARETQRGANYDRNPFYFGEERGYLNQGPVINPAPRRLELTNPYARPADLATINALPFSF